MAGVAVDGALTSGHSGPFPPTTVTATASTVFINGLPVVRVGDPIIPHTRLRKPFDTHGGAVSSGSGTVFAQGIPVAMIGDSIDCGDAIASSSPNVFSS